MNFRPKRTAARQERTSASRRGGVVLVVDDERSLLAVLERQFRLSELYPVTAATIAEAWAALDSRLVHVVIADARLPDGSGAQLLRDVGRRFRGIGRILLTGLLDDELVAAAQAGGFVALEKRIAFAELLVAVRRELG